MKKHVLASRLKAIANKLVTAANEHLFDIIGIENEANVCLGKIAGRVRRVIYLNDLDITQLD